MATDPYLLPGTNTLKNLAGINDFAQLQRFEAISTAQRISELRLEPITGAFDVPHLQSLHHYVFQDVYSWAGRFRTVDMATKGGSWFCRPEFIQQSLTNLFLELERDGKLKGKSHDEFCSRAGYYISELNAIHPFVKEMGGPSESSYVSLACTQDFLSIGRECRERPCTPYQSPASKKETANPLCTPSQKSQLQ